MLQIYKKYQLLLLNGFVFHLNKVLTDYCHSMNHFLHSTFVAIYFLNGAVILVEQTNIITGYFDDLQLFLSSLWFILLYISHIVVYSVCTQSHNPWANLSINDLNFSLRIIACIVEVDTFFTFTPNMIPLFTTKLSAKIRLSSHPLNIACFGR